MRSAAVLIAALFLAGCPKTKADVADAAATTSAKTFKLNEVVGFDDSEWVVLDAKVAGKKLKANTDYAEEKSTEGKFVQVHYKVTNKGKKEEHILDVPKLVDDKGREYGPIEMEAFYVPQKGKSLGLEALQPQLPKELWTVMEVPQDATGLKLQIHGLGLFGDKKLIDLGI